MTTLVPVVAWLRQTSTIIGIATLAGIGATLAAHQITWLEAIGPAAAALVAMALPGNASAQDVAAKSTRDVVAAVQQRGLGGSTLALGSDLVTVAGLLHPNTPVIAVTTQVTPIPPSSAPPAPITVTQAPTLAATQITPVLAAT